MTVLRDHRRDITPEFIDSLVGMGASADLVAFASRKVLRYSQDDLDRAQTRSFWFGILVVGATALIFLMAAPR